MLVFFVDQPNGRLIDGTGHHQAVGDAGRRGGHDQHVLDGNLLARVFAAAEEIDRHPRQADGLAQHVGEMPVEGTPSIACARAKASETARIALAPRRALLGVPSRSISARSRAA